MAEPISSWVAINPDDVSHLARRWIQSSLLNTLVTTLGGPPSGTIEALLAWTSLPLDTRAGENGEILSPLSGVRKPSMRSSKRQVHSGSSPTAQPQLGAYDNVLLLGGTTSGNQLRTALISDLLDRGLRVGEVYGLTAHRRLSASERDEVAATEGAKTEWKHLIDRPKSSMHPWSLQG